MTASPAMETAVDLQRLDASSPQYAADFTSQLLVAAAAAGASDVHLDPLPGCLAVRWRIDGVLQPIGQFPRGLAADVVTRLKVLAELLTYRTDVPQEGRIRHNPVEQATPVAPVRDQSHAPAPEMRVSTFPTLHGERAVVRLFAAESRLLVLRDLGLPEEIDTALRRLLTETSGAAVFTGPAGSGKTTTAYACLREIVRASVGSRSLVTLEDPIESALDGVSQSQVQPALGFDLAAGLRSLMRQDPEVILVGEIRDPETAATVFQAALTGHLVLSTFHAGGAAAALSRLIDMGIEPYLLRSGLRAVLHQRLLRRLCTCQSDSTSCSACRGTGYAGRLAIAEMLPPLVGELGDAVLGRRDALQLAQLAAGARMTTIAQRAAQAVQAGQTDEREVLRVLGFYDAAGASGC